MNESNSILRAIPELEPDIPATSFEAPFPWLWVVLASLLVLLLAAALVWWLCRRRPQPHTSSPREEALAAIDELEGEQPALRECCLRLSLILRAYLSGQTQDPALYETHEEFSHRMDSLASVPAACRYDTHCLLESLAEQKYAAEMPEDARLASAFTARCRELVQRIADAQAEEAAADADEDPRP